MTDADDALIAKQLAYYRAVANEYEQHAITAPGEREMSAAVDAFIATATGDVLELACGPGMWTERLVARAKSVTAVDGAPEMLARARARVGDRARFIEADLFGWTPDRRYDAVFFGFWLSHVPLDRFASFWAMVADALAPNGRVFFIDDAYRTPEELVFGEASATVERKLLDGTPHLAIKVPHEAKDLEQRLADLGWRFEVRSSGPFYWGTGSFDRS